MQLATCSNKELQLQFGCKSKQNSVLVLNTILNTGPEKGIRYRIEKFKYHIVSLRFKIFEKLT